MSNLYRTGFNRRPTGPSRLGAVLRALAFVALAVGVFVLLVMWFRGGGEEEIEGVGGVEGVGGAEETEQLSPSYGGVGGSLESEGVVSITLTPLGNAAASGTAMRTHQYGMFSVTAVAQLPAIDGLTTAYEAWFVKPGITDFFSLGELFYREDSAWGLAWEVTDVLARTDIDEFHRLIITREPRDGNTAPSADQVLEGEFE